MGEQELWEACVAFHGHACGGLTIGFKAALYAARLLGVSLPPEDEIVCVSENDACGVDAVQRLLGCTAGKGNLLFHMTGKQVFTFYRRKTGRAVRLALRPAPAGMTREDSFAWYQGKAPEELFDAAEPKRPCPEQARLFDSYVCAGCGEAMGANWARVRDGKFYCLDCYPAYDRFHA